MSNILIYAGWVHVGRGKDMQITDEANTLEDLVRLTHASEGLHSTLIDEVLANRVLAARHKRVFLAVRRVDRTYILTPMLHSANCGEMLRGKVGRRSDTGPRHRHYGSTHACLESSGLDPESMDGSHDARELEERVLAMLNGIRLSGAIVSRLSNAGAGRVRTRPGNEAFQERIDEIRRQHERLRDTYVLGDTPRDQYLVLRAEQEQQIRELERQLGSASYPLETTLARINQLGDRLSEGTPRQRKQALSLMFSRISVSLTGEITEVEPQPWVQPLFVDLVALSGDNKCPQGTFNAAVVASLGTTIPSGSPRRESDVEPLHHWKPVRDRDLTSQGSSFYIPVSVSMGRRTRGRVLSACLPANASRIVAPQSSVQAVTLTNPSEPKPPRMHAMSPTWGAENARGRRSHLV